ncbi:MAG: acyl carrier protein [Deltaproteobacteria bacterium]|nr:acyl carrier protein [Deltaproteobacteria bacterium]MBW2385590.1 acyl carrier protein [Deltaproteobacteria bacterium]MBW2695198.1 acyl carrier protein [Deltaproteobacteria bacterium]
MNALHDELKSLIVETLVLEDVTAEDIETDMALFGDGLGLDSIDSLEIAMVLEERYGVTLEDDPETNREIFFSVASLAKFVLENRAA